MPKAEQVFVNFEAFPSLRGVFELLREGMVGELRFDSLNVLTTLAEVLFSPIKDLVAPYFCAKATLLLSL